VTLRASPERAGGSRARRLQLGRMRRRPLRSKRLGPLSSAGGSQQRGADQRARA